MARQRPVSSKHRVNLWMVPLKMSLAAVLLFTLTITADLLADHRLIHIPDWFTMGGIEDARAILSAMLGCVSTVLALIFSVALLVLSMVANLFGPRLLYRFVQDWVTQACIGLFMGAFIYVFLVFLVTHQDDHGSFIPQVSLITSWFLVLSAFGFLVFYSHRVAVLIQNPDAIGRIVDDLRRAVKTAPSPGPRPAALAASNNAQLDLDTAQAAAVPSTWSGYLQEIGHQALVRAAGKANARISLNFRPGQFVLEGETIATISPPSAIPTLAPVLARNVLIGSHRILSQDLEFGLAQIVEIAIRALSPAINDTFTGIACVDLLGESLTILAKNLDTSPHFYDEAGNVRLQVQPLLLVRLIKQAFDQIRQAAADNPAVLIRLLSTLERLVPKMHGQEERDALEAEAEAVWETAHTRPLVKMDLADIETAYRKAQALFA